MNLKIYKNIRNNTNRITNCENANIDKMVNANLKVIKAIEKLENNGILSILPQNLQEAAQLRKTFPDLSLAELVQQSTSPVSKSGLSHRFNKLCEKAENI
jgi:DNA-binding protein WhiA